MKKIGFKSIGLVIVGMIIVVIGAALKIMEMPYYQQLLITGMILELIGIIYFIYKYRLMQKNG